MCYLQITGLVKKMDKKGCNHNCTHGVNNSVCQTVTEMDWERGIWNAAFHGETERVQTLIDKAKNTRNAVNAQDNAGYTALHYAARNGHIDVCKMLLSNGADVNALTKSGKATPLQKAAAAGKLAAIQFLIQVGADINLQDVDGQTALHKAVENNRLEVVKFLLETFPQLAQVKNAKGYCAMEYKLK